MSNDLSHPPPALAHSTHLSLLERVKGRDQRAWDNLVYIYSPLVYHICHRWQVRGADADDVVQDIFQAVAAGIGKFERGQGTGAGARTFRNWLGGIARNKLTDFFRRQNRQPRAPGGSEAYQQLHELSARPDSEEEEIEAVRGVCHRALELLRSEFGGQTWQAFWRTAVDGQPAPAVAAELNMNPAAVRKAKSRVLHRLKEELGELAD